MSELVSSCFCDSVRNSSSDRAWPFTTYKILSSDLVGPVTCIRWINRARMIRWMSEGISFNMKIVPLADDHLGVQTLKSSQLARTGSTELLISAGLDNRNSEALLHISGKALLRRYTPSL